MLKTRIIPILTFNGFALVKTKKFTQPRMIGNPVQTARVFNSRGVDELVFLDINATSQKRKINLKLVSEVIKECFMPVAIGGGINSIEDINDLLKIGADKVVLKTEAIRNPDLITKAAKYFGSQCITVAVDAVKVNDRYMIYNLDGVEYKLEDFILLIQEKGAGEIILNSVDADGMMIGFNIELIQIVEELCRVPLIVVGGGGNISHYIELFSLTKCDAVGSSSIYHFTQHTPLDIKNALRQMGKHVRL